MNLTIDRAPLFSALSSLTAIVQRKSTIPILTNLLLEEKDGQLRITATDLDMFATVTRELSGGELVSHSRLTLSADKLLGIVKSLPDGADLTIRHDGAEPRVSVQAGRSRFQLAWLPAEDFPRLNEAAMTGAFTLDAGVLSRLFKIGASAINETDARAYFVCAHMTTVDTPAGRMIRVVSYGGNTLVYCEAPAPGDVEEFKISIPPKLVNAAQSFLSDMRPDAPVELTLAQGMLAFDFGGARLSGKLLGEDLKYPDYQKLVPKGSSGKFTADTDLFINALRRALLMAADDKQLAFRVNLDMSGGELEFSSVSMTYGAAEDFVDVYVRGADLHTPLNGTLLADVLQFVATENVAISYDAPSGAPILVCEDRAQTDWLAVIATMGGRTPKTPQEPQEPQEIPE